MKFRTTKIGSDAHGWAISFYVFTVYGRNAAIFRSAITGADVNVPLTRLAGVLDRLRGSLNFTLVLLIATGWIFVKPFLTTRDKTIFAFVLPLQVRGRPGYLAHSALRAYRCLNSCCGRRVDSSSRTWRSSSWTLSRRATKCGNSGYAVVGSPWTCLGQAKRLPDLQRVAVAVVAIRQRIVFVLVDVICCILVIMPVAATKKHLEQADPEDRGRALLLRTAEATARLLTRGPPWLARLRQQARRCGPSTARGASSTWSRLRTCTSRASWCS